MAQETVIYTYDVLGRLTGSTTSGGPSGGTQTSTTFDPAGNRSNYTVLGVPINAAIFSIDSVSAVEGASLTFTITKSGTASASMSVSYATSNGTASVPADYASVSGTVTFLPSETSKTVSVSTVDDSLVEGSETITVTLSGASSGSTIATAMGTGTITDNDATLAIGNAATVTEGGTLTFTVTRTGATSASHSVNYASASGTATSGADFTASSGTLTFLPGEATKSITVPTTDDAAAEPSETVLMNLSAPTGGATIATGQGSGTITDNDASFTIGNGSVTEGSAMTFTVTRTGATSASHSVSYASADGSATSGVDFTATSGTLTFLPGETSKTITVPTIDDNVAESPETIFVNLSGPTGGATIAVSQGVGAIHDNDAGIAINNAAIGENGMLVFTVTRTGAIQSSYSVSYATASGTAISGVDFTAASGSLTFTASDTTKTIVIAPIEDTLVEGNETMLVNLYDATGGAVITAAQGTGTIIDNDFSNRPPRAQLDITTFQCTAYKTVNLVANDTDPENNVPLHLVSITAPPGGYAVVASSTSATIGMSAAGTFTFTYVVSDSLGATSSGQLTAIVSSSWSPCLQF